MNERPFAIVLLALVAAAIFTPTLAAQVSPRPTVTEVNAVEINTRDIVRQVVPRDAIPALVSPKYDAIKDATYMYADDRVIALEFADQELAYPTRILERHELVNDVVHGQPILITY
jgi:hypothetical protein